MSASLFAQAMREFFHHHHAWPGEFFEEQLARIYSKLLEPGNVAVDIGAHTGYHSTRILERIGPSGAIYCIEPLPEIFELLSRNLKPYRNATLINGVLSDSEGELSFQRAIGIPGESGLKERQRYDLPNVKTETITVKSATLDKLAHSFGRLDYIKIDTEGAELTILSAAERVLKVLRPVVSVEWGCDTYLSYGHEAASLFRFARAHGYSVFDLFSNMVCSEREWMEVTDRAAWDFILVPDEKLAWYLYRLNA